MTFSARRATDILLRGVEILDPIMKRHGFEFVLGKAGRGSGGNFASGKYVKDNRILEIHFRHTLGLVTYHIGPDSLRHEIYMRASLGKNGGNRYPCFSDDPLEGFRVLRSDLENYCSDFLEGNREKFRQWLAEARAAKKLSPLERLDAMWPGCIRELL